MTALHRLYDGSIIASTVARTHRLNDGSATVLQTACNGSTNGSATAPRSALPTAPRNGFYDGPAIAHTIVRINDSASSVQTALYIVSKTSLRTALHRVYERSASCLRTALHRVYGRPCIVSTTTLPLPYSRPTIVRTVLHRLLRTALHRLYERPCIVSTNGSASSTNGSTTAPRSPI